MFHFDMDFWCEAQFVVVCRLRSMDNPTKRKKVTPEVTSIWSPPFFHPPWHSRSERSSYVWPPTLELGIVRGEEEMKRKLLRDALAGEGLQEVTYKMYVVDEDEDVLQTFYVFEATARGFFAARLGQHELNIDYMIMEDVDIRVKNEALKKDVNWVPIVSDVEKDISTEYPLAPALHEGLVKVCHQKFLINLKHVLLRGFFVPLVHLKSQMTPSIFIIVRRALNNK